MNDAEFKSSVERDARRAGWSERDAAKLAQFIGKRPPGTQQQQQPRHRAAGVAYQGTPLAKPGSGSRDARIAGLLGMFGAEALAPEVRASGLTLATIAHWLGEATGSARYITAGGIERVRLQIAAQAQRVAARGAA